MVSRLPDAAIYRRIAQEIRDRIADGRLQPGQRLGSMASLMHEFDVGQATIVRALNVLRFEGAVVGAPGEISRVADKPTHQVIGIPAGGEVSFRLPTDAEARELRIPAGVWLAVVVAEGRTVTYPIDRTHLRFR